MTSASHPVAAALPPGLSMHQHPSLDALARAVAAAVEQAVVAALRERDTASLVLTGGGTPQHYLPAVAALDLPWERVQCTLSDERRVPADHAHSNAATVAACLLQGRAAAARFVPLVDGHDVEDAMDEATDDAKHDATAVAAASARVQALPRPFDLVLLGLGADSHIASLFPGAEGTGAALDPAGAALCCAIVPPHGTHPPVARISLTLAALLDSRRIVIAAQGTAKRDAFERAARGDWPLPSPLRALALHARQPVDFVWCA